MENKPAVLLVDDDPLLQELVQDILGQQYALTIASTGREGIAAAHATTPDVILMDILMEDMSGYDACATIKNELDNHGLPIIFLSGLTEPEDRMRAYEVGGSDFLAKPFAPNELLNKIGAIIRAKTTQRELTDSANNAFQAAMTAMTSASESGIVMQYVTRSCHTRTPAELAQATLEAAGAYGLKASVQLRGASGTLSMNDDGPSSPLEVAVLSNLQACGRIVNFGARYAFTYEGVTLLISNMPIDDEDRSGRLRDHLCIIAEVAHSRMQSLDTEKKLQENQGKILDLFGRVQNLLAGIEQRSLRQREQSAHVLQAMLDRMEDAFLYLGLTEPQENAVADMLKKATQESLENFGPDVEESRQVAALLADMATLAKE